MSRTPKLDRLKRKVSGTIQKEYEEWTPPRVKKTVSDIRRRGVNVSQQIKVRSPRGKQILIQSLRKGVNIANPFSGSKPQRKKRREK